MTYPHSKHNLAVKDMLRDRWRFFYCTPIRKTNSGCTTWWLLRLRNLFRFLSGTNKNPVGCKREKKQCWNAGDKDSVQGFPLWQKEWEMYRNLKQKSEHFRETTKIEKMIPFALLHQQNLWSHAYVTTFDLFQCSSVPAPLLLGLLQVPGTGNSKANQNHPGFMPDPWCLCNDLLWALGLFGANLCHSHSPTPHWNIWGFSRYPSYSDSKKKEEQFPTSISQKHKKQKNSLISNNPKKRHGKVWEWQANYTPPPLTTCFFGGAP